MYSAELVDATTITYATIWFMHAQIKLAAACIVIIKTAFKHRAQFASVRPYV
jgi:hypothetical protein